LNKIGRARELDVLQAEQERLQAENNLRDAEESHKDSLLAFKTFLGLPDHLIVDIRTEDTPPLKPVEIDPELAIAIAFVNRLDLTSAEEQLEDTRRGLKIVRNSLLPDLNITAGARTNAQGADFGGQVFDNHSYNAGVNFSFPLDRVNEKLSVRQAEISLEQQERSLSLLRDQIASDVRRRLRDLTRIEKSMEIQKRIVETATRGLANAEALFRQGTRTSRDVVEAQQALLAARNAEIQFQVDHAIAELQFRQALGVLSIDQKGRPVDVAYGQKNVTGQVPGANVVK
jgi:outer membrane protein